MAPNNDFASLIIVFFVFFILLAFTGEANIAISSGDPQTGLPPTSSETSECLTEYINRHMKATTEKTKEFLREDIVKRLDDKTLEQQDRECLNKCFNSYAAAIGSIEQAINDLSVKRYSEAIKKVLAYSTSIEDSLNCTSKVISRNGEFVGVQKWAYFSAEDIIKKLKSCSK